MILCFLVIKNISVTKRKKYNQKKESVVFMPRSGGGGSHHSSSHHSSSHHSNYRRRHGRSHYGGSESYDNSYTNSSGSSSIIGRLFTIAILIFFLFVFSIFMIPSILVSSDPSTKKLNNSNSSVFIKDSAEFLSESDIDSITSSMTALYDKTGITPSLITVNTEDWYNSTNLDSFSLSLYQKNFYDENHLLLVFSKTDSSTEYADDLYWAYIVGNNLDRIISDSTYINFENKIQNDVENEASVCQTVNDGINYLTSSINIKEGTSFSFSSNFIITTVIYLIVLFVFVYAIIKNFKGMIHSSNSSSGVPVSNINGVSQNTQFNNTNNSDLLNSFGTVAALNSQNSDISQSRIIYQEPDNKSGISNYQNTYNNQNTYGNQNSSNYQNTYGNQNNSNYQNTYGNQNSSNYQNTYGNQNNSNYQNTYGNQNSSNYQNTYGEQVRSNYNNNGYNSPYNNNNNN